MVGPARLIRRIQHNHAMGYFKTHGLDTFVDLTNPPTQDGLVPHPPHVPDLVYLHRIICKYRCAKVLEFGVGYSTLIMSAALYETNLPSAALHTVDTSQNWIEHAKSQLPEKLEPFVHFHHTNAQAELMDGQLCHLYTSLPDIVPDLIYLDGPAPSEVMGEIKGLTFPTRKPIAADVLLYESTLKPGARIVVDGRSNNLDFLLKNLKRDYHISYNRLDFSTTFTLRQSPLKRSWRRFI